MTKEVVVAYRLRRLQSTAPMPRSLSAVDRRGGEGNGKTEATLHCLPTPETPLPTPVDGAKADRGGAGWGGAAGGRCLHDRPWKHGARLTKEDCGKGNGRRQWVIGSAHLLCLEPPTTLTTMQLAPESTHAHVAL